MENYCIECGAKIHKTTKSKKCHSCAAKDTRICERPSREELKNLIREKSFLALSKEFEVSDKAIVKWCVAENLPSRKKDIKLYSDEEWQKI